MLSWMVVSCHSPTAVPVFPIDPQQSPPPLPIFLSLPTPLFLLRLCQNRSFFSRSPSTPITTAMLKVFHARIKEESPKGVEIPDKLSSNFITRWKRRFNLATRKMEGETGQYTFTDADYDAGRVKMASDIFLRMEKDKVGLDRVLNVDETALNLVDNSTTTIAPLEASMSCGPRYRRPIMFGDGGCCMLFFSLFFPSLFHTLNLLCTPPCTGTHCEQ